MAEQDEKKSEDKPEEKKDFKSEWDTARQEKEQAEANYTKAVAENEAISEELVSSQTKIAELEEQITAKKDEPSYPDLDDTLTDGNVIKSITQMRAELKEAKQERDELKTYAETHKASEEQRQAQVYEDKLIEKIHKPLDKEFGVKYHNQARALADKLIEEGKEKKPADAIDAMNLMRKCYIEASKEPDKKGDSVRTDSGGGGITSPSGQKKAGTNVEIFADLRSDSSWKDEPIREVT